MRLDPGNFDKIIQADSFKVNFAGSEASVACNLSSWGFQTKYLTALPNNDLGKKCERLIKSFGTDTSLISIVNDSRMGLIFLEKGANQRASKVIYDRSNSAFTTIHQKNVNFDIIFSGIKHLHLSGITLGLSEELSLFSTTIVMEAKKRGIKVSIDLNYRNNLWKYCESPIKIMTNIMKYVDILIGNEEDIQKMLGIGTDNDFSEENVRNILIETNNQYKNLEIIALSNRISHSANNNSWSGFLYNENKVYLSKRYKIKNIVDRVGAGDSFSSGIIAAYYNYKTNFQKILDFAVAASCLKHSINGDFCLVEIDDINKLMQGNCEGRIIR